MLFMVIETFAEPAKVYARFRERGRMAPDAVRYVDSWVDVTGKRCFQLMDCDDLPSLKYLIEDAVFERVERILSAVGTDAELEIIRYAA